MTRLVAAYDLLDTLVPNFADLSLWKAVALGENVHLPASDQYGPIKDRLKPTDDRARRAKSNKVHDKGEAPSQFFKRQGLALQLRSLLDMGTSSGGLMGTSPG